MFLDTDVDLSRITAYRETAEGGDFSVLCFVLRSLARVLPRHPACLAAAGGGLVPRLAWHEEVRPKIAMDREVSGQRVVLSAVLPDLRGLDLAEIRAELVRRRETPVDGQPELRGTMLLHRLPARVGWAAFRAALAKPAKRPGLMGTVAVSSLGHRAVNGFHALGGTTLTFNLGQVRPTPIVREGVVVIAPVLRLNLCFDHRVVDGAEAADVLTELKEDLETFMPAETGEARLGDR